MTLLLNIDPHYKDKIVSIFVPVNPFVSVLLVFFTVTRFKVVSVPLHSYQVVSFFSGRSQDNLHQRSCCTDAGS